MHTKYTYDKETVKKLLEDGYSVTAIAERYQCAKSTISRIKKEWTNEKLEAQDAIETEITGEG